MTEQPTKPTEHIFSVIMRWPDSCGGELYCWAGAATNEEDSIFRAREDMRAARDMSEGEAFALEVFPGANIWAAAQAKAAIEDAITILDEGRGLKSNGPRHGALKRAAKALRGV